MIPKVNAVRFFCADLLTLGILPNYHVSPGKFCPPYRLTARPGLPRRYLGLDGALEQQSAWRCRVGRFECEQPRALAGLRSKTTSNTTNLSEKV